MQSKSCARRSGGGGQDQQKNNQDSRCLSLVCNAIDTGCILCKKCTNLLEQKRCDQSDHDYSDKMIISISHVGLGSSRFLSVRIKKPLPQLSSSDVLVCAYKCRWYNEGNGCGCEEQFLVGICLTPCQNGRHNPELQVVHQRTRVRRVKHYYRDLLSIHSRLQHMLCRMYIRTGGLRRWLYVVGSRARR